MIHIDDLCHDLKPILNILNGESHPILIIPFLMYQPIQPIIGKNAPPDDHIMSAIALKEPEKFSTKSIHGSASAKVVFLPKT